MRHAFMSEELNENAGFMMITITDPRLKEELYESLNPVKLSQRQKKLRNNAFYLSKAADYHL
jgi:hypothetical protein